MRTTTRPVAIVTGGGSGLGEALCWALGQRAMTVICADIDEARALDAAEGMRARDLDVHAAHVDVTDPDRVQALVERIAGQHGRIDQLYCNAGTTLLGGFADLSFDDWRRLVDVNLWGVVNCIRAVYPVMLAQGRGHIVTIASGAGIIPGPFLTAYTATKHAVFGLSVSLRAEAAASGVRVSAVCPGAVRTPLLTQMPSVNIDRHRLHDQLASRRLLEPAGAARIILDGVDRNRPFILFPMRQKVIWWLYRMAPATFEKTLLRRIAGTYRTMRTPGAAT